MYVAKVIQSAVTELLYAGVHEPIKVPLYP